MSNDYRISDKGISVLERELADTINKKLHFYHANGLDIKEIRILKNEPQNTTQQVEVKLTRI